MAMAFITDAHVSRGPTGAGPSPKFFLCISSFNLPSNPGELGVVTFPVVQMRKLRHR